jgi:hypothetical protein
VDDCYHINYADERRRQPPVMVFWDEENAKRRSIAWEHGKLGKGTVRLQTQHIYLGGSVFEHIFN